MEKVNLGNKVHGKKRSWKKRSTGGKKVHGKMVQQEKNVH